MADKPILVIMAAGMGSRYGGLKQIDPIDAENDIIMDFSVYDAKQAGFEKVIFIIKHQIEKEFKASIGDRLSKCIEVEYVFQELDKLPEGYSIPEGRVKPFGTGHAILCAKDKIHGPFAVINADDYYGRGAFEAIYHQLSTMQDDEKYRYTMVGYHLPNTLTENGHVARGVCSMDENHYLQDITEHTRIERKDGKIQFTEDDGATYKELPEETIVSMNMWGFNESFLTELENRFVQFLDEKLPENPEKAEYFLPSVVDALLKEDLATVEVLESPDKWYGVTYKEDKPVVMEAMKSMKEAGKYPKYLWAK